MCKIYILSDIQDPDSSEAVTLDEAKRFLSHIWLESPSHTEEEIDAFVDEIYAADFNRLAEMFTGIDWDLTEAPENNILDYWCVIDSFCLDRKKYFLLENKEHGDTVPAMIVDDKLNVILENVWNGKDDLIDFRDEIAFHCEVW